MKQSQNKYENLNDHKLMQKLELACVCFAVKVT